MDQKSWLWKKRSTEKTLVSDKATNSLSNNEQLTEVQKLVTEKTDLERDLRVSNEKLSSALSECNAKDNIAKKQVKIAEEAIAGWEKAESEAISLKQQLDEVVHQKVASDERIGHLDAALKECMHQLRLVRTEQEKNIHRKSEESEKTRIGLDAENAKLIKSLSEKDKVIGDLSKFRSQVEAELKALLLRVESTEKENASLKYEVRVLEKQLDIRSEEREFNRRSADVAQKQLQESAKKIVDLEKQSTTLSYRNMGASDMNLMDDFAEMEKLADVSVDYPAGNGVIQTSSAKPDISTLEERDKKSGSQVSDSIHKIVELLEGINIQSQDHGVAEFSSKEDGEILPYRNSENPTGYIFRVFQWKAAELSAILLQFIRTCNDLLNEKADVEQFVQQVASNLEWVINHCFSIQDASSMKDAISNPLYWDESDNESDHQRTECNKLCVQTDDIPYPGIEEGKIWNVEWGDEEKESSIQASEFVKIHHQESKDIVENLDSEMESMEQSREKNSDQIEKQKMMKQDLTETNHEWRKACERISHLENELENRSHSCRILEETCHDLKIQIQSMTSKDASGNGKPREKQLQSDWEITAASEKLAECQETILNLGKQLKALASPNDAPLFDKVIPKTATKNISRSSSLLNKMLTDDNNPLGSSRKENQNGEYFSSVSPNAVIENSAKSTNSERFVHEEKSRTSMDIVPRKKKGSRNFFKKLFWPHKKGNSCKIPPS